MSINKDRILVTLNYLDKAVKRIENHNALARITSELISEIEKGNYDENMQQHRQNKIKSNLYKRNKENE